jgi:hypothetical protein
LAIHQELENYDMLFRTLSEKPIILNDISITSEEDKNNFRDLVYSRYTSDMVSLLPACKCGATKGEHAVQLKTICSICNTPVTEPLGETIAPTVWFRRPTGVAPLMNIGLLEMLRQRFTKSKFQVIDWLTDTGYRSSVKRPAVVDVILAAGVKQGYNNFYQNFDAIIDFLFTLNDFKVEKGEIDYLWLLIQQLREERARTDTDPIFSDYLPLPNKALLIVTKVNTIHYAENSVMQMGDILSTMVSIDKDFHDQKVRVKENRTAKYLCRLCDYYTHYFKTSVQPKKGLLRRHLYGSRLQPTFRTVITSITEPHNRHDLHIPWAVAMTVFRQMMLNKLTKKYDLNTAKGLLFRHVYKYSAELDAILDELFAEAPHNRIPVIFGRNPSLKQGSMLRMDISYVKKDPFDLTTGLPITVVKSLNADFDGDACNMTLAVDNYMADMWESLRPEYSVMDMDRPDGLSNNIAIPKTVIASISNWFNAD